MNGVYERRSTALRRLSGSEMGRLVTLRDITEQKNAEGERERLIRELDAYAHTVAHDLKSPLSIIIGHSDLMQMEAEQLDPDLQISVNAIEETAYRLQNIVEELLLLASLRKQDEVHVMAMRMVDVVDGALFRLSQEIDGAKAIVQKPTTWPTALGYQPWVEAVWVNYISNALKYGGDPPEIELGADTLKDGMVCFWVKDNGHGLTQAQQDQLFVEFARLEQKARRRAWPWLIGGATHRGAAEWRGWGGE